MYRSVVAVRNTFLVSTCLMASVVAVAEGWRSPEDVAGATTVSAEEAHVLFNSDVPFLDVRSARQFAKRRIQGAYHLDLHNGLTEDALVKLVGKDQPFVVYCNGVNCSRSYRACAKAVEWGFAGAHYFRGGIADWRRAGLPVETDG